VVRLGGRTVTTAELHRLFEESADDAYVGTVALVDDTHLVPPAGTIAHYVNHSCEPTLWPASAIELAVRWNLDRDRELPIDYGARLRRSDVPDGTPVLIGLTDLVFARWPNVTRFEGHTRDDNLAMRATFRGAAWFKEAFHRDAWPVDGATPKSSVAYAVLRRDWETGTTTPIVWDGR